MSSSRLLLKKSPGSSKSSPGGAARTGYSISMTAIGLLTVDLQIHGNRSLKGKRKVVKSITTRLRNKFNVSVAEVDFQDKWQRCRLGVSAVSDDTRLVDSQLNQVVNVIEGMGLAVVLDYEIEFF